MKELKIKSYNALMELFKQDENINPVFKKVVVYENKLQ